MREEDERVMDKDEDEQRDEEISRQDAAQVSKWMNDGGRERRDGKVVRGDMIQTIEKSWTGWGQEGEEK